MHRRVPGSDARPEVAAIARARAARRCVKVTAGQHASCAMWRSPQRTRFSRNPRQSRRRDLRCGTRTAPRIHSLRRLDWLRPFRDGRAMPFTRTMPPHRGAALHGGPRSMRECEGRGARTPAPQNRRQSRPGSGARQGQGQGIHPWRVLKGTSGRATGNDIAARGD